jgi:hypothetical protein
LTIRPARGPIVRRTDRVSGGWIDRPISEREFPFAGGTIAATAADSLAVVAPEIFSLKVDTSAIGLLLVRSPFQAHHDPTPAAWRPDYPVTDQGQHEFEMRLWPNVPLDVEPVDRVIEQMLQPPIVFDLTG